jgi:ribosome recycling factor
MTSLDDVLLECEEQMSKTVEFLASEFGTVRTGKASPALVENLSVEAYPGTVMKLRELAGITTPEARLLVIQPWDVSTVDPIRKALESSSLGINPMVDGKIIRIPFPELSQQRREDLVKVIKKMSEEQRVVIRHARRDALDALKKLQKDGKIPEDNAVAGEKEVQKLTDQYIEKVDKAFASKEKDLMKV